METNVSMKSYSDYINDPFFMKWIFQPDDLSEKYWKNYIEDKPEEKKLILSIREELSKLKLKNKVLSESDKKSLFQNILKHKQEKTLVKKFKYYQNKISSYAALALLFVLLGNILVYLYLDKKQETNNFSYSALEYTFPTNEPKLTLSDGTDIPLKNNSLVKYIKGKIVIDNKKIIIPRNKSSESIPNQLFVPNGSKVQITLSDNTVVYLNAGSKLIYPPAFKKDSREILLIGEAFFKVTKNKHKPFFVKTPSIDVKVFGTSFNVSAYPDDKQTQAVLVEGEISVKGNDPSISNQEIKLKPNQILSFDKQNKKMNVKNIDIEYYTLWKDGMLKFEDEPLNQIIKKVERLYDLTIVLSNPLEGQMKISGKLNLSERSKDVFEYLSILTKMNFEKINENYYVMK